MLYDETSTLVYIAVYQLATCIKQWAWPEKLIKIIHTIDLV